MIKNKYWSKIGLSCVLFIAVIVAVIKISTGNVSAAASKTAQGDVSTAGNQAVTNNPDSFYDIWDNLGSGGETISVAVWYTCSSGGEGFTASGGSGVSSLSNSSQANICASVPVGTKGIVTMNLTLTNGCATEPSGNYCHAIIDMHAQDPLGGGGHFSYTLVISNGSNPSISQAAQDDPTYNPGNDSINWPGNSEKQFGLFSGGGPTFQFQTPCNFSAQTIYVAWSGADDGASYQPTDLYFVIKEDGNTIYTSPSNAGVLGGFGDSKVFSQGFSASAGHVYTWQWFNVDPSNEIVYSLPFTQNSFDYGQSCAPSWTLSGGTGAAPATITPGQSVQFNNSVTNNGPDNAKYYWHVQGSFGGGSGTYNDIGQSGTPTGVQPGTKNSNPNNLLNTQTPWPTNTRAPNGSTYCERIVYTNPNGPGTKPSGTSPPVCITLQRSTNPVVTCNSTFVPELGYQNNVPPPASVPPPPGDSFSTSTTKSVPTYADITITGTNQKPSNFQQGTTLVQTAADKAVGPPYYSSSDTTTTNNPNTVNYSPTGATVTVSVVYYEYALLHSGNYYLYQLGSPSNYNLTCYSATPNNPPAAPNGTCSLSVSGGNGPGGVITAGQSVTVSGTIYNYPDPSNSNKITLPPNLPNGDGLSLTSNGPTANYYGAAIPVGAVSGPISWGVTANSGPNPSTQTVTAYPDYYGSGPIGPSCSVSFSVYAPFSLTPYAQTTLNPTLEAPTQVNNNTWVVESGAPVSETVTSSLNYTTGKCGSVNPVNPPGVVSNGGAFNPGTTTYLIQNNNYAPCIPRTAGDTYCSVINVPVTVDPSNSLNIPYVGPAGDTVGGAPATASSCPRVVNEPFFKINNSDVSTGSSFPNSSGKCIGGELAGWNNNTGTYPSSESFGAGSQLNALAALGITGFGTNQSTPPNLNNPPTNLSFANTNVPITTDTDSPSLGGEFGNTPCYIAPSALIGSPNLPSGDINAMANNGKVSYTYNGNLDLFGGSINPGTNLGIYVNGDVYIHPGSANGITYNGSGNSSWNLSNIPSFVLSATGNIYIDPGVTELDGFYSAQPNSAGTSGGNIYTCGVNNGGGNFKYMDKDSLYTSCNGQLTVYGSFQANHVNLMRTFGSLRDETPIASSTSTSQIHTSIPFNEIQCTPPNGHAYGVHFYQLDAGPGGYQQPSPVPASCYKCTATSSGATCMITGSGSCIANFGGCSVSTGPKTPVGNLLPAINFTTGAVNCDTPNATPLYYYKDLVTAGDNYYDNASTTTLGSNTYSGTVVGCVPPFSGAPGYNASIEEPVYRFYEGAGFHLYTTDCNYGPDTGSFTATCNSASGARDAQNVQFDGINFYAYTSAGQGGFTVTTVTSAKPPPLNSNGSSCSNWSPSYQTLSPQTCAAEVFALSPELYLSQPSIEPPNHGTLQLHSLTSLPPIL